MPTLLPREKVEKSQTWNSESVFPSPEAFDTEVNRLMERLVDIKKIQGRLDEAAGTFLEADEF